MFIPMSSPPTITVGENIPPPANPGAHLSETEFDGDVYGWWLSDSYSEITLHPTKYSLFKSLKNTKGTPLFLASGIVIPIFCDSATILGVRKDSGKAAVLGGMIVPPDTPSDTARREYLEETGYPIEGPLIFRGITIDIGRRSLSYTYTTSEPHTSLTALNVARGHEDLHDDEHHDFVVSDSEGVQIESLALTNLKALGLKI